MATIDYVMLADLVTATTGDPALGAEFDVLTADRFPFSASLSVVFRLRVPAAEPASHVTVRVAVISPHGYAIRTPLEAAVPLTRNPQLPPTADYLLQYCIPVPIVRFPNAGTYMVVLMIGGIEAARTEIHLVHA